MTRDPYKLEAFVMADALVLDVYAATKDFPSAERYGLQSQLRRGAVSVAANLVEGSTRRTQAEYVQFIAIALGSASEVRYLISVAARLAFVDEPTSRQLTHDYHRVIRTLQALLSHYERLDTLAKPEA